MIALVLECHASGLIMVLYNSGRLMTVNVIMMITVDDYSSDCCLDDHPSGNDG